MKNFYFTFLLLLSGLMLQAQDTTVNITFFVNVTGLSVDEGGMRLSGGFNEWGDMAMLENTDGNWYATVALTPGTEVEYKFKNGQDGWEDGIQGDCVNGFGNRALTVPAESQSIGLVGFNNCASEPIIPDMAAPSNVTFSVDMNGYDGEFTTVYVSGSLNSWAGDANALGDEDGDGIWSGIIPLAAGTYEYKFTLDNWAAQEEFAGGEDCTLTTGEFTNRVIEVGGDAEVCFKYNACDACGAASVSNVNFSVDMNGYEGEFTQVYVSGSLNGWAGDANALNDSDGDGIWSGIIPLEAGTYEYKFTLDNWAAQEEFAGGEDCTLTTGEFTNRVIEVAGDAAACFTWNTCTVATCGMDVMTVPTSDVSFSVDMNGYEGEFTTVYVSGSLNGWAGDANALADEDGDGVWAGIIPLADGTYEYKFTLDNWTVQEEFAGGEDCTLTSGDFTNRIIEVAGATEACFAFNTCNPCAPMMVDSFNITFTVDMSKVDAVDPEGVFLAGSLNGWTDQAMMDNGDGTWSVTNRLGEGDMIAYKFKNGTGGWEANEVRECTLEGTLGDRGFTVGNADAVIPTVCFNSCYACNVEVTFTVDASQLEVAAEGMFLAGSFNEWTDGAMTDNADGTWSATVVLSPGDLHEYKFKNGPDGWEDGIVGSCTSEGGNRVITVGAGGQQSTVCFNTCVGCNEVTLNLTVDMNQETINETGVFIAGAFNEWTDGAMTDNGNGTYSTSIIVDKNTEVEYKFKNGPDGWEDGITGDCVNGFGNRFVAVADVDITQPEVCFNACTTCTQPMVTLTVDMSEQTVAAEGVFLTGSFNEFADMPMMDNGDGTWSVTIELAPRSTYEYKFKNGPDGFEEIAGACTVGFSGNRELVVGNVDKTIPTVCFQSCVGCGLVGVTFTVDMSQEKVDAAGALIAGSFTDWTDVALNDVGNGLWSATIGINPNDTIEFKYKNGPEGWEGNIEGACANADSGNRSFIVTDMDGTVAQTCFNSCEVCMDEPDPEPVGATSLVIENSCWNDDGTLTIRFNYEYNCDIAPGDLSGMDAIGFHSGVNSWSTVIDWDAEGAVQAINTGNDVFEVTIDPVAYYGLGSIDELENIFMVFNQGPAFPDDPWSSEGKAEGEGGLGACADIFLDPSELKNCSDVGGETLSSPAILAAGSCLGADGTVEIKFNLADNCAEASGSLAGMDAIGFHSGANDWSSIVEWNGDGAVTATNDGNDVFSVSIDPASYYGIELADLSNIFFVFNQGASLPDDPWGSEAKAQGDGACVDFNITISELAACPVAEVEEQKLPLDFESSSIDYKLFGFGTVDFMAIPAMIIDNPDASGPNPTAKVLQIEKPAGAQVWAGVAMPLEEVIDFTNNTMLQMHVWSPRAGSQFLLKIEDTNSAPNADGNPSVFAEVAGTTTSAMAWETLTIDLSQHSDFDAANPYNQVVVFPDFGNEGAGELFYVDNIRNMDAATSTEDLVQLNQFKVAPNPFNDKTLVTWNNLENKTYQVSLLNVTGQLVRNYSNVTGENLRIQKGDLQPGMYFLNFRDEAGNTGTMKLLME